MENKTMKDEKIFIDLFTYHQQLPINSDEFFSSREEIARKILSKYKTQFELFKFKCSSVYRVDPSDCESWIYEAVLKTIERFKVGRGNCKFNSYLWTVINSLIKTKVKTQHVQKRDVSMTESQTMDDTEEEKSIIEQTDFVDQIHNKLVSEDLFSIATPKEKEILELLLVGKSFREISRELKLPCSTVEMWTHKLGSSLLRRKNMVSEQESV